MFLNRIVSLAAALSVRLEAVSGEKNLDNQCSETIEQEVRGTTQPTDNSPLKPPIGIRASSGLYPDKISVNWDTVSGATSYEVYRCTTTSTNSCTHIGSPNSNSTYFDTQVTHGVSYYYRVQSVNASGSSGFSDYNEGYIYFNNSSSGFPGTPTGVNATDTLDLVTIVSWNPVQNADYYRLYVCTSASLDSCSYVNATTQQSILVGYGPSDPRLIPQADIIYYYRIKAVINEVESNFSDYDTGIFYSQ